MDDVTTEEAKMPPTRNLPDCNNASNNASNDATNNDDSSTYVDSKPRRSTCPKRIAAASNATIDSQGCVSSLTNSKNEDTAFQDISIRQQNIVEFMTWDDVSLLIEAYAKKSGNRISIRRSLVGDYWLYISKEHVNCTFQIYVGQRQVDDAYIVKRNSTYHSVLLLLGFA